MRLEPAKGAIDVLSFGLMIGADWYTLPDTKTVQPFNGGEFI